MHEPEPSLVFALALGAGVTAHAVARHLRIPSIVPLLFAGVALGPDFLGWVVPDALGEGLFSLVVLAVAVVLFEGGLNLELRRLRREAVPIRMLVTVGALITAIGGALAARFLMEWSWTLSVLFGTLVIVTGPTVVRPILRNVPLGTRLATVVEAEGVLIDPVGAIIAAVTFQVLLGEAGGAFTSGIAGLGLRLGFGTLMGLGFGFGMALLLRAPRVVPEGLENILTLGLVLVLFEACETVLPESGILAVTLAGVVVGNSRARVDRELREFQDNLTLALIALLFVLLAADVRLEEVKRLGWPGFATVAALMLLVRPVNVFTSTAGSELSTREKAFLSWIGPRGIVAAAVASIFAAYMEETGVPGGSELRALVFLTIAVTVVVQGASAPLVARAFGVLAPAREGVAVLGAEEFGLAIGDTLQEVGIPVTFMDANPGHCRAAQERGFAVVFGNALEERTQARARLDRKKYVVALTANDEVNSLFARVAHDTFTVSDSFAALNKTKAGVTPAVLEKQGTHMLFDGPKDVERWNVRFRHGSALIAPFRFVGRPENGGEPENETGATATDRFAILMFQRGKVWRLMHAAVESKPDDLAAVAIHTDEEEPAHAMLAAMGWEPAEAGWQNSPAEEPVSPPA